MFVRKGLLGGLFNKSNYSPSLDGTQRWLKCITNQLIPFCLNCLVLPNCGHPGSSENAVPVLSTYWAGEWVRYLCNPGYTMLGPAVRRCLPSGQWSGNAAQCKNHACARDMFHVGVQVVNMFSRRCFSLMSRRLEKHHPESLVVATILIIEISPPKIHCTEPKILLFYETLQHILIAAF